MHRPLSSFPLPSTVQASLASAGFSKERDLDGIGAVELGRELNILTADAEEVLRVVRPGHLEVKGQSAFALLKAEQSLGHVVSFCAAVDAVLGGGVGVGRVTEVCGEPGTGKTQVSIQLAVDVSIPEVFGGLEGEALYIDTEGGFIVERVAQMASAALEHLGQVAQTTRDSAMMQEFSCYTLKRVLASIHYIRCHDYLDLLSLINVLPEFITEHPKIRLVVVDSIAAPFKLKMEDMALRTQLLILISRTLLQLAIKNRLAVVITNQMTTRLSPGETARLVPALGESWGHACTQRLLLCRQLGGEGGEVRGGGRGGRLQRIATLLKSPTHPPASAPFSITSEGVRDLVEEGGRAHSSPKLLSRDELNELESGNWEEEGEEEEEGDGGGGRTLKRPRLCT